MRRPVAVLAALAGLVCPLAFGESSVNHTKTGNITLSVGAALADNTATPTVEKVGAFIMCYDGSNWDMCPGTAANGIQVYSKAAAADLAKDEDAAHTTGDRGVMVLGVRAAAPTDRSVGNTDGDYEPLALDALGKVWTSSSYIEDAAETAGGSLAMAGAVVRSAQAGSTSTDGDNATLNVNGQGALYVVQTGHAAVVSGIITVTTAGTSVQGSTATTKQCWFSVPATAGGAACFLGAATGDNRSKGLQIIKSQNALGPLPIQNLNLVWGDCLTSGDTIDYFCTN